MPTEMFNPDYYPLNASLLLIVIGLGFWVYHLCLKLCNRGKQ